MTKWMRLLALVAVLVARRRRMRRRRRGDGGTGGDGGALRRRTIPTTPTITEVGEGEGEVNIIAWAGYIEDGSTDENYDWVTSFEEETGCEVNVTTAGTSDEMVALMQEGGGQYDLVTASGDASLRLIAGGTVQPVNLDLIESYSDGRRATCRTRPWLTVDTDGDGTTEHYGAPYRVGVQRADVLDRRVQGQGARQLVGRVRGADPARRRVERRDGSRPTTARSTSPTRRCTCGRPSPTSASRTRTRSPQEQFDAALDLLRQQRELINRYWHDAFVQMDDFVERRGRRELVVAVPGELHRGRRQGLLVGGPEGGRHRLGRHDDDAHRGAAPQLRLPVDGALARPEGAGRPRLVVRVGAVGAGRLRGQRAARSRRVRRRTASRTSTRSSSGRPRSPTASRRTRAPSACRTSSGSRTTSR